MDSKTQLEMNLVTERAVMREVVEAWRARCAERRIKPSTTGKRAQDELTAMLAGAMIVMMNAGTMTSDRANLIVFLVQCSRVDTLFKMWEVK